MIATLIDPKHQKRQEFPYHKSLWIYILFLIMGLLFCCLISTEAQSQTTKSTLITQLSVQEDYIKLKDIFNDLPEHVDSQRAVLKSPRPGRKMVIDSQSLLKIAKINNIAWRPIHYTETATIHRISKVIPKQDIENAILEKLAEEYDIDLNNWQVNFDRSHLNIHLSNHHPASFRLENFSVDSQRNQFSTDIIAPDNDTPEIRLSLSGRMQESISVPVLTSQIRHGQVIRSSDLLYAKIPKQRLSQEVIQDARQLIGYTPKKMIAANTPIQQYEIQPPVMISKGSIVTVNLATQNLQLTMKAKALDYGAKGERIRLLNTQSNTTIEAEVTGLNQAQIDTPFALALNN